MREINKSRFSTVSTIIPLLRKKSWYMFLFVLLAITLLVYYPVTGGFFQHDEWTGFGRFLLKKESWLSFFSPKIAHYSPLQNIIFSIYFSVFKLNFIWYALASIINHLIVVYLSFVFFSTLFRKRVIAFLCSIFFAVSGSSYQATSWIAADINTHGASIFGLLSLIVLYKYNKKLLSVILLAVSLLFKEVAIALFLILPLMIYILDKEKLLRNIKSYLIFPFIGFFYLLLRCFMLFFEKATVLERTVLETQSLSDLFKNAVTFPAKVFAQSIIPTGQLLEVARFVTKILPSSMTGLYGTTAFDIFVENTTLQIINWTIFLVSITLLIWAVRVVKDKRIAKVAFFGFIFTILNSFVYILSPGRAGNIPVIDSRNIYFPSLGSVLFVISIIYIFSKKKVTKTILIVVPFLLLNVYWLNRELKTLANIGTERKEILYEVRKTYPYLPKKVIFYAESDSSYYGLPEAEKIFPFETNFGYTLMVWYQSTEHFPKEFLDKLQYKYLYNLTDEGYKEVDGRGFGYIRNFDLLVKIIKENKLSEESIIAYRFYSSTNQLVDITQETKSGVIVAMKSR